MPQTCLKFQCWCNKFTPQLNQQIADQKTTTDCEIASRDHQLDYVHTLSLNPF